MDERRQRRNIDCRVALLAALWLLAFAAPAAAQINPWIAPRLYDPRKWDSAGPDAATPWLHPGTAEPGQGWGLLAPDRLVAPDTWSEVGNVTGDWGGFREKLHLKGISFLGGFVMQLSGNPVGGLDQGFRPANQLSAGMFLDLGRLAGWTGSFAVASVSYVGGGNLTADDLGNQFVVQNISGTQTIRLVHMAFGQRMFDNIVEVVAGRLLASDDFGTGLVYCSALNRGFCSPPINVANNVSFSTFPFAVWGARVKAKPVPWMYAQVGAYNSYGAFRSNEYHGVNFTIPDDSGVLVVAEAGYLMGAAGKDDGLPGKIKLGGSYDSEPLTNLQTGLAHPTGTWSVYATGEQMLFSEGGPHDQGVEVFLTLSYAPPDVNLIEFQATAGTTYRGAVPGRDEDTIGLFLLYGQYSSDLREGQRGAGETTQTYEAILELNYRVNLTPWFFLQPDIQGVIRPSGKRDIPSALVLGLQTGVQF